MPPPAHDGHTVDAGHVHTLTADGGGCTERCPHPDHVDAPLVVTFHHRLEPALRQWVDDLGLKLGYLPLPPGENAGMRTYAVAIPPDSPLLRGSALDPHVRR